MLTTKDIILDAESHKLGPVVDYEPDAYKRGPVFMERGEVAFPDRVADGHGDIMSGKNEIVSRNCYISIHTIEIIFMASLLFGCASVRKKVKSAGVGARESSIRAGKYVVAEARSVPGDITPRTKYQREVLYSSILPGGGWIYECNVQPGPCEHDVSPGVWYFLATGALIAVAANGIRQHDGMQLAAAAGGITVFRFADILGSMRAAKRAEYKK